MQRGRKKKVSFVAGIAAAGRITMMSSIVDDDHRAGGLVAWWLLRFFRRVFFFFFVVALFFFLLLRHYDIRGPIVVANVCQRRSAACRRALAGQQPARYFRLGALGNRCTSRSHPP